MQADQESRRGMAANSGSKSSDGTIVMDPRRLKRLADVSSDGPSRLAVFRRAYASVSLRASVTLLESGEHRSSATSFQYQVFSSSGDAKR